jgi:sugar phosphate isomerase/epimerase
MSSSRRQFLSAAAVAAWAGPAAVRAAEAKKSPNPICFFEKPFIQMPIEQMADHLAELGFDGVEATCRAKDGRIKPESVQAELPRVVEALKKRKLEITILTTDVNRVTPEYTTVLKTAAALGIKRYRIGWHKYDLKKPILPQLDALKPIVRELAGLNQELGITGMWQNHSGADYVSGSIWDLEYLLRDIPPTQIASAFDIGHATVEGGYTWNLRFQLIRPHIGICYFKDLAFTGSESGSKRRFDVVPLGKGMVDPGYAKVLKASGFAGPCSLHMEYEMKEPVEKILANTRRDLATLRSWLA